MMFLMFILLTFKTFAFPPELNSLYEQLEVHEFYKDNELITKPLDAWQTIASFSIVNKDLSLSKACFKYRPGSSATGVFKIDLMAMDTKCNQEGDKVFELTSLYGIQFTRTPQFTITFSHKDYSTSSWTLSLPEKKRDLSLLDNPDMYWGESVLFLGKHKSNKELLADGVKCLNVLDDCSIQGQSTCHQCKNGFLEAPNGCLVGPQYCSSAECGTKGNPACRRGVKFQKRRTLDCRTEMDFAFCQEGTVPTCQGLEVWCL